MRPLRLRLEAFGPFLDPQEVDFERVGATGLFLIHGPTGSGKSTLLDAMTYALFDTKKVERSGAEFVSTLDEGAETKVVFEFQVHDEAYRVTRSPAQRRAKVRGDGLRDAPAEALLERLDAERKPVETLADRARAVSEEVEALLGCTAEQFRQTVVLPQGQFREVVTDDEGRRQVLARVFDTGRFAALTRKLKEQAKRLSDKADDLQDRRRELLGEAGAESRDQLENQLETARAKRQEATAARKARQETLAQATTALETARTLQARFEALTARQTELDELQRRTEAMEKERERLRLAERAAKVADRREARDRARDALERATTRQQEASDAAETARARRNDAKEALDAEEARSAERAALQQGIEHLAGLEERVRRLDQARAERSEAESAASRLGETEGRAQQALGELDRRRTTLDEERVGITPLANDLDRLRAEENRLDARAKAARELHELARRQAEIDERRRALERVPDDLVQGHGATLLEVVRHHAAGLAAADLAPGTPCPVCGSTEHPHPHDTVDAEALRAILEQYERARHDLAALATQADEVRTRRDTVLAEHDWDDAERPSHDQLATSLSDTRARREQAEGARNRLTEIDGELHEITQERERQQTRLAEARTELAGRRQHIDNLGERIREVLDQLPEELHQPDAFHARLRERRERLAERTDALEKAKEAHAKAGTEQETAAATLKERDEALATARTHLSQAQAELRQRLHACGFSDEDELAAAAMDPDALQRRLEALRAFDTQLQQTRTRVETLRQELADQAPPDLDALQAAKGDAQRAWDEADEALRQATQAATTLEDTLEKLDAAEKAYERSRQRLEATQNLANLAGGKLTGRAKIDFETFVLQSIFGEVLRVGNAHLHRMTGGRYALHLVRDETRGSNRGLELEVADHHAGGARRPAKTLSGGEGFLAALALALGLSECAQRYSGGVDLGALFVDEGFGSLDEVALEKAVNTLRHLPQAENRMVGVITHVAELKRRIPTQVLVEPQDVGSTITVRRNA